ncbi:dockerin type I domain-containing protein [Ruminococcus flavefaciens]|uniref:Dockerin domain-containing protein n=1 Tax=Ruminococcus flavefaciens 007c TaxID=1341157 RepID=W7UVM6_RUMFL|nr:dockerin type I domain-containing protein [Ruminococcus flavefaciens]EWM52387.1 hypothetical protein RF007C_13635 [Ruminococcus flavefaciens 007c]
MIKKRIDTCIAATMMLSSMLTGLPVNDVSAADSKTLTTVSETADSGELLTFEELYALEEDELKQYCSEHDLTYKSKEYAEERVAFRPVTWVNVKLNDYLLKGESDLLESNDRNDFNKKNYYDYDFEKMTSDLKMPEKYYKFHAEKNDFSYGYHYENDADGNTKQIFQKYAAIFVEPDPSVANERSLARLYQLIYVWTQQNPIVYGGTTMISGPAPDSPVVIETPDTLGDVNSDGYINAVDASSVLSYYARISTNQEGGYDALQKLNADVNQDRSINAIDASNILAYYAYASTTKEDIVSLEAYMKKADI